MPKVKTHSSSKKRFKITGTGKVKMSHAFRRHRLISKSRKAKKRHRLGAYVAAGDAANVKGCCPTSRKEVDRNGQGKRRDEDTRKT